MQYKLLLSLCLRPVKQIKAKKDYKFYFCTILTYFSRALCMPACYATATQHTGSDATHFVQKIPKTPKFNFWKWDQYLRNVKVNILEQYISYFIAISFKSLWWFMGLELGQNTDFWHFYWFLFSTLLYIFDQKKFGALWGKNFLGPSLPKICTQML